MTCWFSNEILFSYGLLIGSGVTAYAFMRWENQEKKK
jgi:hypothetical protein